MEYTENQYRLLEMFDDNEGVDLNQRPSQNPALTGISPIFTYARQL
jgi:hypothetical protein